MKRIFFYIIALSCITMLFASCKNENAEADNKQAATTECGESDHLINATLWMQHSAEYRACCLQTYKLAKVALAENLKAKQTDKPAAVVLDIDETVLDNSYYEAYMAAEATSFRDSTWAIWTSKADATEVPGAIDFLKYAQSLGVEIIFISNRYPEELEPTMANMKKLGNKRMLRVARRNAAKRFPRSMKSSCLSATIWATTPKSSTSARQKATCSRKLMQSSTCLVLATLCCQIRLTVLGKNQSLPTKKRPPARTASTLSKPSKLHFGRCTSS